MRNKLKTGENPPGKLYLSSELYDMKVPINLKDPVLEGLDVIYDHIKKIQEEQDRELLTEYLKDKCIVVGTPLVKAKVESDERFKDCKVYYCKYADPDKIHFIRQFGIGMLEEVSNV